MDRVVTPPAFTLPPLPSFFLFIFLLTGPDVLCPHVAFAGIDGCGRCACVRQDPLSSRIVHTASVACTYKVRHTYFWSRTIGTSLCYTVKEAMLSRYTNGSVTADPLRSLLLLLSPLCPKAPHVRAITASTTGHIRWLRGGPDSLFSFRCVPPRRHARIKPDPKLIV